MTITEFIKHYKIKTITYNIDDCQKITFRANKRRFTTILQEGEQTAEQVLNRLINNAYIYSDNVSLEQFCKRYNYDITEHNSECIYDKIRIESNKFKKFLGSEVFYKLLYNVKIA
jgi:hypothetical protein